VGWQTHGDGRFEPDDLGALGEGSVIEPGVLMFHAGEIHIGRDVYIGHRSILRGDTRGAMRIGDGSWIGEECYFQSAGGIEIGAGVGVGPRVSMITATHAESPVGQPIISAPLVRAPVVVGDGCDIGLGSILLPGTELGEGVQVGAGSVVKGAFARGAIIAGVPARVLGQRRGPDAERGDAAD
jgi:acetyltransferase-like isoleucine patch superfamily enzyme